MSEEITGCAAPPRAEKQVVAPGGHTLLGFRL